MTERITDRMAKAAEQLKLAKAVAQGMVNPQAAQQSAAIDQARVELQVLGATTDEIHRYEEAALRFAQQTEEPNSAVMRASYRLGRRALAAGMSLIPSTPAARQDWGLALYCETTGFDPYRNPELVPLALASYAGQMMLMWGRIAVEVWKGAA